jgi:hypothetical protein
VRAFADSWSGPLDAPGRTQVDRLWELSERLNA